MMEVCIMVHVCSKHMPNVSVGSMQSSSRMDRWTHGHMAGWLDGQGVGVDGWDELLVGVHGCLNAWMHAWIDGCMQDWKGVLAPAGTTWMCTCTGRSGLGSYTAIILVESADLFCTRWLVLIHQYAAAQEELCSPARSCLSVYLHSSEICSLLMIDHKQHDSSCPECMHLSGYLRHP